MYFFGVLDELKDVKWLGGEMPLENIPPIGFWGAAVWLSVVAPGVALLSVPDSILFPANLKST